MNLVTRRTYNFEVYPAALIGQDFKHVKLLTITSYEDVRTAEDFITLHRLALSELPEGTSRNVEDLTFLVFLTASGDRRTIAYEWIKPETIEVASDTSAYITVPNVSTVQLGRLRAILAEEGFKNFTIELKE